MNARIEFGHSHMEADEELLIERYDGELENLDGRSRELLSVNDGLHLDRGDWIVIMDGEVTYMGDRPPFRVKATDEH